MRDAARTVLVSAVPAAVVAATWLRFEQPRDGLGRAVLLVVLALGVAAVRPLALRAAALVPAAGLAAWLCFRLSPLDARPFDPGHDFFGPLGSSFGNGFLDFYDVRLPFDPALHQNMRGVVLAAVFAFTLLVALAVAARRPVAAALALLAGAGWPATLLGPSHALLAGTAILLACLVPLAGLGRRRLPFATLPVAAGLAVAALALSSSPAVAKQGLVGWQRWDPYTRATPAVSVSFVWDSQYLGLHFPRKKTTVLEVQAPRSASLYWRAAVLDDFLDDAWIAGAPRRADWLEPPAASRRKNQTEQTVTVKALADTRLVGGSEPIRFDAGDAPVDRPIPGSALLPSGLTNGFRYRVWSYAPQPSAAQLRRSPPAYPSVLRANGLLDVTPGVAMPAFGTPARAARARGLRRLHPELAAYAPLAQIAERLAGSARTPYGATVTLEEWFRSSGGFTYTNSARPLAPNPLVGFVTQTRAGYCQYFAGAMALMLRYLGIPTRVAVGFSSGTYDAAKGAWIVTDHDAHAWVEVWFAGYGWLPFDPTTSAGRPEQGALSAGYSASSPAFRTGGGASRQGGAAPSAQSAHRHGGEATGGAGAGGQSAAGGSASHGARNALLTLLALLLAATLGGIALVKLAIRSARLLRRDPRRIAAGCRQELAAFLLDQRIDAARSATLHELGALVRYELLVDADRFVAAATAARFGRVESASAAAHAARRELRALLREVRRRLTGRERLRGLLSLRSLGLASSARG
jgi:transglutaminase-like putative cysteine protease